MTGSLRPEALARGPGGGLAQSSGGRSPRDEDMRHCPEDRITRPLDEGPIRVSGGSLTAGSMGVAQATRNCALVLNLSFQPALANDDARPGRPTAAPRQTPNHARLKRRTGSMA